MQEFFCKTKIYSGAGAVTVLGQLGIRRLFLVTDPFFMENGMAKAVAEKANADCREIYHRVQPDPTVTQVAQATAAVKAFQPDTIVALGGGSAIDSAKAMAFFAGGNIPIVAIPTTSGSGSEVTDFSILTHNGIKHPLVDGSIRPTVAILDSDFLTALPKSLIADSGFDVLAHALEALAAKNAGAITDALATAAFCTVFDKLTASYQGNTDVRGAIHEAATMAGIAFTQAGLGLCHGLSHALGGAFHVPHGRLNAILLPEVLGRNAAAVGSKYAALASTLHLGGSAEALALRSLKNALVQLRRQLALPATLAQAGICPAQLAQQRNALVEATLRDPCCATNPVPVTAQLVNEVLEAVAGRG